MIYVFHNDNDYDDAYDDDHITMTMLIPHHIKEDSGN